MLSFVIGVDAVTDNGKQNPLSVFEHNTIGYYRNTSRPYHKNTQKTTILIHVVQHIVSIDSKCLQCFGGF